MASSPSTPDGDFADDAAFSQHPAPSVASSQPPQSYPNLAGASVYTPTATPSAQLNPRSCVTCRRRKVRCDKHMPCSNCRRAQISCIFPAPGRAPRRPRPKDPNAPPKQPSSEREIELMKRLRKLEGIVEDLSGQIELETARNQSSNGNSPEATNNGSDTLAGSGGSSNNERAASVGGGSNASQNSPAALGRSSSETPGHGHGRLIPGQVPGIGPLHRTGSDVHKKFGRLVLNDHGKTRYVSSAFWSKITDELDELRAETQKLTDEDSDLSDDESTPATAVEQGPGDHHAFIFGYRSADVDLRSLHPLPSQISYIWQVFQENVDPLVKVLHIPTVSKLIREIRNNLDTMTPATEALMFSIYYSAITSLDDDDVKLNFGVDKPLLISQYRFALEQALAKAGFLTTSDIVVLQAFVLFLVLVRRHDDTRFAWTLTGLVIRIASSLGLHRDGSAFPGLTPFEIEMRRRLFWALIILDLRSAEDQGTDLTIMDRTFDTQFPLNINDADISPESTEFPPAREGTTDMTFCLIRYEICSLARRLHTVSSAMAPICPKDHASTLEDRERMIREVYNRVETRYLNDPKSESNPMYWTAARIARVIVAKMILLIYQPILFTGPNEDEHLSGEIRSRLFSASIEIFEYNHLLNTDPRCRQWRWLFQTYTQWHAVAYILMELTKRPWGPTSERAWTALNSSFTQPNPLEAEKLDGPSAVWVPFKKLYLKAKKHRDAEIQRLMSEPTAAQALELEDRVMEIPTCFASMPGPIKSAIANERWRRLVNAPPLPPGAVEQREHEMQAHAASRSKEEPAKMPPTSIGRTPSAAPGSALEFIDHAMAQPSFEPENFWPIALSTAFMDDARQAAFGCMGGNIPRQDDTLANYAHGNTRSDARMNPLAQGQQPSSATPLVDAVRTTNPPPWLWGESSAAPAAGTAAATTGLPNMQVDDVDINMDEDFNWQDWGQSIPGTGFWSGQAL